MLLSLTTSWTPLKLSLDDKYQVSLCIPATVVYWLDRTALLHVTTEGSFLFCFYFVCLFCYISEKGKNSMGFFLPKRNEWDDKKEFSKHTSAILLDLLSLSVLVQLKILSIFVYHIFCEVGSRCAFCLDEGLSESLFFFSVLLHCCSGHHGSLEHSVDDKYQDNLQNSLAI